MERHWNKPSQSLGWVRWKDLTTGKWQPPTPLLVRVRGAVCVFPPGSEKPIWVPERCIRHVDPNTTLDTRNAHHAKDDPTIAEHSGKGNMGIGEDSPPC